MARTLPSDASGRLARRTLDPKLDVVFKMLFAAEKNRDLLISLLTAVLAPASAITSVDVLNPEIDREHWDTKGAILDIRVRFADGQQVDVEMQATPHGGLRRRVLLYWARLYASQLVAGEDYTELMPVFGVFILGFNELPTPRLHSVFEVRERHEGYALASALELHFLELPKLAGPQAQHEESSVLYWCRFFAAKTDEELEQLAMAHPNLRAAKNALDELSADPKARQLAEDRALWHWTYDDGIATARQQGEALGLQKGEALGLQKGEALGLQKGEALGLRTAVRSVCELLKIELSPERVKHLEQATTTQLEELLTILRLDRRWPD